MSASESSVRAVREPRSEKRREDILDAALRVFARAGYTNATTKEIAREAGIRSPTLLYWYFDSKEALLREVFLRYAVVLDAVGGEHPPLDIAPDAALPRAARAALAFFANERVRLVYRLWMMEWPLLERLGISLEKSKRANNVYTVLERYLVQQVRRGNLRPHDTQVAARSFIALIWSHVEARYFFPSIYPAPLDDDAFIERAIGLFLDGLRPR